MELDASGHGKGRLKMQRNKVHAVTTVDLVAIELGETVDDLLDIALEMETEDGVIWVYAPDHKDGIMAFSEDGVACLKNLIEETRKSQS